MLTMFCSVFFSPVDHPPEDNKIKGMNWEVAMHVVDLYPELVLNHAGALVHSKSPR